MQMLSPAKRLCRRFLSACGLISLAWSPGSLEAGEPLGQMIGFTEEHAREQAALEERFDKQLHAEDQQGWVQRMAAAPNHVGSLHDKANAEFMLTLFREWGWNAR